jgi:hypothetical protein
MEHHEIDINHCAASTDSEHVDRDDRIRFRSTDTRSYQLTGLGDVLKDVPDPLNVPAGGCTDYYKVNGEKGSHVYGIGPDCAQHDPPEIIIDD